jgi:hypothetical protein
MQIHKILLLSNLHRCSSGINSDWLLWIGRYPSPFDKRFFLDNFVQFLANSFQIQVLT